MPKNNKSVGRKKWIAGGIIGFASVTLIATGFATWIIGNQIRDDEDDVTVAVDTARNDSVTLAVNLTEKKLFLGGKDTSGADSSITSSVVTLGDDASSSNEDLTVTATITVTAGADYVNNLVESGVTVTFAFDETSTDKVTTSDDKLDIREDGSFTYLEAPAAVTIAKDDFEVQSDGTYLATLSDQTLTFTWGSYFKSLNPMTYYNGLFQDGTLSSANAAHLQGVIDELNKMNEAITGGASDSADLTLTSTLTKNVA